MDPWLKLFFRSMNFWTVLSWASVHFVVQGFSGFWVGGSEILKCDHCCCSLLWTLHIAFDSVNERPRTERFHELILLHVAWVTETFHARFPVSVKPSQWPARRSWVRTSAQDESVRPTPKTSPPNSISASGNNLWYTSGSLSVISIA